MQKSVNISRLFLCSWIRTAKCTQRKQSVGQNSKTHNYRLESWLEWALWPSRDNNSHKTHETLQYKENEQAMKLLTLLRLLPVLLLLKTTTAEDFQKDTRQNNIYRRWETKQLTHNDDNHLLDRRHHIFFLSSFDGCLKDTQLWEYNHNKM